MFSFLKPQDNLTDADREHGLSVMNKQTFAAAGADGFVSAGFLSAFALLIGASNLHIGILTAIPFVSQALQIVAVVAIERIRMRKAVVVVGYLVAYSTWIPVALIPFILDVPHAGAVTLLLVFVAIRGVATSFVVTGWNSWLRDIIPVATAGNFFGQRLRRATIAAIITGLGAAIFVDWWKGFADPADEVVGYSIAFLFGSVILGYSAVGFMSRVPEPRMVSVSSNSVGGMLKNLSDPFTNSDFRKFINFLFVFYFVINLAVPFFAVYMLQRLDLPLSLVVGLGVLSQVSSVIFYQVWGNWADRFGSKVILSISASLYFLVIIGWTFTTLPERHAGTIPILVFMHLLLGVAIAGVNIGVTSLRMKMAPAGQATSYMAAASLALNLGAGSAPLIGGAFADFFDTRSFRIEVQWIDPSNVVELPAFSLTGFDFLFAVAFLLGFAVIPVLSKIPEAGETDTETVLEELRLQTRENLRGLGAVPGGGAVSNLSVSTMRYAPRVSGLDIAVGVTAYQISAATKSLIDATTLVETTLRGVRGHVRDAVRSASQGVRDVSSQGAQIAFGVTNGAVKSIAEAGTGSARQFRTALRTAITATNEVAGNPREVLAGAVRGAVAGTIESGYTDVDLPRAVIRQARVVAPDLGVTEDEAVRVAASAVVEAMSDMPVYEQAQAWDTILRELVTDGGRGQGGHDDANETPNSAQYA